MTLIIDKGFTIQKTAEERLAELERHIAWLFEQQDAGAMSAHDVSYEVATCQDERLAIIKRQAAQQRDLDELAAEPAGLDPLKQITRPVGNVL